MKILRAVDLDNKNKMITIKGGGYLRHLPADRGWARIVGLLENSE